MAKKSKKQPALFEGLLKTYGPLAKLSLSLLGPCVGLALNSPQFNTSNQHCQYNAST